MVGAEGFKVLHSAALFECFSVQLQRHVGGKYASAAAHRLLGKLGVWRTVSTEEKFGVATCRGFNESDAAVCGALVGGALKLQGGTKATEATDASTGCLPCEDCPTTAAIIK